MSFDLKITGGLIYDGDGGEPLRANIAVKDGRIAEIGACDGDAKRTLGQSRRYHGDYGQLRRWLRASAASRP